MEIATVRLEGIVAATDVAEVLEVYEATSGDLFGFALATTRSRPTAEELVQESFLRLIEERRRGRRPTEVRAWLFRVCANLVRSRSRRQSAAARWLLQVRMEDTVEGPEPGLLRGERSARLRSALDSLPVEMRIALMLAAEGFSGREVARILGRTEGSTRNLLWRGRVALRAALGEARNER